MRETKDAILEIKSQYNNLNNTDKKIADFIITNPNELVSSTISDVAEKLELSDATIFRFCTKIGFKGFQDLKISLALKFRDIETDYSSEQIQATDDQEAILNKVFLTNIKALTETSKAIDYKSVEEAVQSFLDADRIVFLGNGGSGIVANDAQHKFIRTGLRVNSYVDYHMQLMAVSQLTDKDIIVVISHTGSNLSIMNLLDIARENGTKSIAITSYAKSPVNEKADIAINVISQETKYQFEAFASRIAHLSVIDALYISVMLKREKETNDSIKKMRDAISSTRI